MMLILLLRFLSLELDFYFHLCFDFLDQTHRGKLNQGRAFLEQVLRKQLQAGFQSQTLP